LFLLTLATALAVLGALAAIAAQFALTSAFVALVKRHEASFAKLHVHIFTRPSPSPFEGEGWGEVYYIRPATAGHDSFVFC
jgi:hypothetical protein